MKVSCYDDEVNTVVRSLHLISVYGKVSAEAVFSSEDLHGEGSASKLICMFARRIHMVRWGLLMTYHNEKLKLFTDYGLEKTIIS